MTATGSLTDNTRKPPTAVLAPVHWSSRRRLRARWRWIAAQHTRQLVAAVTAVIVVIAVGSFLTAHAYPADGPVRALFAALTARDATTAGQLAGCDSHPLCDGLTLTTGYQPPTDLHINHITNTRQRILGVLHDTAAIHLTYHLPDHLTPTADIITVLRSGGLGQNWTIQHGGYGTLTIVSTTQPTATVAATTIPTVTTAPEDNVRSLQPALPGIYTITGNDSTDTAAPSHNDDGDSLLSSSPQEATVTGADDPVVVTLHPTIQPSLQATVQSQVDTSIDQCAAQTHDILAIGCPFQPPPDVVSYHVGDDVTWTITTYPHITLTISTDPDADGGPITVTTTTPGHATATWTNGTETDDIIVHGIVTTDTNGQPTYQG